jgi:hypothetical protein
MSRRILHVIPVEPRGGAQHALWQASGNRTAVDASSGDELSNCRWRPWLGVRLVRHPDTPTRMPPPHRPRLQLNACSASRGFSTAEEHD